MLFNINGNLHFNLKKQIQYAIQELSQDLKSDNLGQLVLYDGG